MAVSVIRIIRMLILYYNQQLGCDLKDEISKKHIEKIFVWVFGWAVGATIISDDFAKFERLIGDLFSIDNLPRGSIFNCLVKIVKNDGLLDIQYI